MLKLATDADIHGDIIRGLRRREPTLDLVTAHEAGLRTATDQELLEWAATEGRVLLTQDRNTMTGFAIARIVAGSPMPGLVVIDDWLPTGRAVEDILILASCCTVADLENRLEFIPL